MKKINLLYTLQLVLLVIFLQSCQGIGLIFKAGMWSGIVIIVLIMGAVLYLISKGNRRTKL